LSSSSSVKLQLRESDWRMETYGKSWSETSRTKVNKGTKKNHTTVESESLTEEWMMALRLREKRLTKNWERAELGR
jgi:hypothetical protein